MVITTIEKRFGLRSSQTGLVASGYDIASFVCLVPVTYVGGRSGASKPRWIGIGMALMGIGSLVFSLPHFLVGAYRATNAETNICSHENSNSTVSVVNGNGAHCRSKPKKKPFTCILTIGHGKHTLKKKVIKNNIVGGPKFRCNIEREKKNRFLREKIEFAFFCTKDKLQVAGTFYSVFYSTSYPFEVLVIITTSS